MLALVLAAGCGVTGDESGPRKPDPLPGDGPTTVAREGGSGTAASEDPAAEEDRVVQDLEDTVEDNRDALLAALTSASPDLGEPDLDSFVQLCGDLVSGEVAPDAADDRARSLFGVDEADAAELVGVARRLVCPDVAD